MPDLSLPYGEHSGASRNPLNLLESRLEYPFGDSLPAPGKKLEVGPGIFWIRKPLPFALDHINLWLLRDHFDGRDGWTAVDCGIGSETTRAAWDQVIANELDGLPLVRVLCTHTHPDHLGNAGWLTERFDAPLWMTLGEYAMGRVLQGGLAGTDGPGVVRHFIAHGLVDREHIAKLEQRTSYFSKLVPEMPFAFRRIEEGEHVAIGAHRWRIITGFGHSPEHAALYADDVQILISGDMLLPRISTNVSVHAMEPESNPLQQFLDSIDRFVELPDTTLVLPSHGKPFRRLHERVRQLHLHHTERLAEVREMCRTPTTARDVVPVMFRRELDSHQLFFAFGEALAHLHALWYRGELTRERGADGVYRFRLA
jgi:glyoxylase-like metal-dependent hydrolase (beta-lactamase superfamily II)